MSGAHKYIFDAIPINIVPPYKTVKTYANLVIQNGISVRMSQIGNGGNVEGHIFGATG